MRKDKLSGDSIPCLLQFLLKLDGLKQIQRQTLLTDSSRRENTAEHSWHLAMYVLVFAQYSSLNHHQLSRAVAMALVHDIVEIEAGDTYVYDEAGSTTKRFRELAAARNIFGLLPEDLESLVMGLWEEFEAQETAESRYVLAMDRASPLFQNIATDGVMWQMHGITHAQVIGKVMEPIRAGCPLLADHVKLLLEDCVRRGILPR